MEYIGKAIGYGGELEVSVLLDNKVIKSINIISHNETRIISDPAFLNVPSRIIKDNSINVPNVKGCSITSMAIKEAVMDALLNAGFNKDDLFVDLQLSKELLKIVHINSAKLKDTYDLIVVGAGGAGLTSAISAAENGAKVLVLEKMSAVGGNTLVIMGGVNIPGSDAQIKNNISDSIELYIEDALKGGDYENNKELLNILANNALDTYKWLKDYVGIEFKDELIHFGGHTVSRATVFKGKYGIELVSKLQEKAINLGVTIKTGANVKSLIMDNNYITGVKVLIEDNERIINASKAVILSTGGFSGNVELRKKYNKEFDERYKTTNQSGITGDGHVMLEAVDASFIHMNYIQTFPIANPVTGSLSHIGGSRLDGAIMINKEGNRFVEEMERRDVISQGILSQTDNVGYLLWSSDVESVTNRIKSNNNEELALRKDNLFTSGTLDECLEFMNIDINNAKDTLFQYNKFVDNKLDKDFNRRGSLVHINSGTYYIQKIAPAVHHTMGGVQVNNKNQVLNNRDDIIKGLYACGEIVGGIHGTNRLGGNAVTDITVFGRLCGLNAIKDN